MNTAAITTASTVTPFTQNLKQPQPKQQTAKEAIAANVQALIEQLEQGHSEGLTAYLTAMGRFHNYSFGNILEIARQKPDATRVAGLYAWNQLGRKVKKGERGIRILAPVIGSSPEERCRGREGHPHPQSGRIGWVSLCLRLRCFADRRQRASLTVRARYGQSLESTGSG